MHSGKNNNPEADELSPAQLYLRHTELQCLWLLRHLGVVDFAGREAAFERALSSTRVRWEAVDESEREEIFERFRDAWPSRFERELWFYLSLRRIPYRRRFSAKSLQASVQHRRHQFAVGQGGFHAAILSAAKDMNGDPSDFGGASSDSVMYVYDCGSIPRSGVDRSVDELIKWRAGNPIDILFLSHFDHDHICGTPRLLDKTNGLTADTIVIPYVDHVERLIDFGRNARSSDAFFEDMIVDPVATLQRFEPRQIIIVLGNDDPVPEDGGASERGPDERSGKTWKLDHRHEDGQVSAWNGSSPQLAYVRDCAFRLLGRLHRGGWKLVPYVRHAAPEAINRFERTAERLLGWPTGCFRHRVTSTVVRRDLVTSHRRVLARAYKEGFRDKNTTSLCLYSGPTDAEAAFACQHIPKVRPATMPRVGWMGTGDADLRDSRQITAFADFFQDELDLVGTFMLPHHGSIHNSDPSVLLSEADFFVVAAKPTNKRWRHPDPELRRAVHNNYRIFRQVTASRRSAFKEVIVVDWR